MDVAIYIVIAMLWALLVLVYTYLKPKKIEINRSVETPIHDSILNGSIDKRVQKIIVSYEPNQEGIDFDLLCDLCIRYEDLLNGTYKIPDTFKKNIKRDSIMGDSASEIETPENLPSEVETESVSKFNVVSLIKNLKKDEKN